MLHSESKPFSSQPRQRTDTAIEVISNDSTLSTTFQSKSKNVVLPNPIVHLLPISPKTWNLSGSGYSEAETFYIWPETGGFILLQIAYSEVVSMFPASQITLRVDTPLVNFFKTYSLSGHSLKSLQQGSVIECDSLKMKKWIQPDQQLCIQIDQKTTEYQFSFTFSNTTSFIQLNDGVIQFGHGVGPLHQMYGLKSKVKGTLLIKGNPNPLSIEGEGTMVHQYQSSAPHKVAHRWQFINFCSPEVSLVTIAGVTPKALQHDEFGTLVLKYKDPNSHQLHTAVSSDLMYQFLECQKDDESNYVVPQRVQVQAKLVNELQEPLTLHVTFSSLSLKKMFKIHVLNELPWLLRKAIQLLFANPVVYQCLEPLTLTLIKTESNQVLFNLSGTAMFEITYTNDC